MDGVDGPGAEPPPVFALPLVPEVGGNIDDPMSLHRWTKLDMALAFLGILFANEDQRHTLLHLAAVRFASTMNVLRGSDALLAAIEAAGACRGYSVYSVRGIIDRVFKDNWGG